MRSVSFHALVPWLLAASAAAALANPARLQEGSEDGCALDVPTALERVNAARAAGASCGAQRFDATGALAWNETLRDMALMQARYLADIDDLRHAGPAGQGVADRAKAAGYRYTRVAENLALGAVSVDHVLRSWTASANHCVNLYDARYTEMALVCTRGKAGRPLWVMVLGRPKGLAPLTR